MKNEVIIDGEVYVKKEKMTDNIVLVRTHSAGVHFGELAYQSNDGKLVTLKNAKRLWKWVGAASLSQVAIDGVTDKKQTMIPPAVPEITLTEAIEIIPMTEKAVKNLSEVPVWKK